MQVFMHICACVEAREQPWMSSSGTLPTVFLRLCLDGLKLTESVIWVDSEFQRSNCLCLPMLGLKECTTMPSFCTGTGDQVQVLMLMGQALTLLTKLTPQPCCWF